MEGGNKVIILDKRMEVMISDVKVYGKGRMLLKWRSPFV